MDNLINNPEIQNLIKFPINPTMIPKLDLASEPASSTPGYDKLLLESEKLDKLSKYPNTLNYEIYRDLELRYKDRPMNGGTVMKTAFRVANAHTTCQQCLYSFEIDTYGRGCVHDCAYCYAKAELTVRGYWNKPIPVPVDFNQIRTAFYKVFETDKPTKLRDILEKRIPLRIGSMSDSFMWMDQKYKVSQELLKLLKFYNYPHIIFTRSDLLATDTYLPLLDPKLVSVQYSISSINEELIRKIEPGAASAKRRLNAMTKIVEAGIWTTARINPLFPIYPDGYFTDENFKWEGTVPKFEFSSFEIVDALADAKVPSVLAGFGRFSRLSMNALERATGFNLRQFYRRDLVDKSRRDFHFSDREIHHYYKELRQRAISRAMEFSTCYIGNGEGQFWKDQTLWSNKKDCCNVKSKVASFKTDSREIPFSERLRFSNNKELKPASERLHEPLGPKHIRSVEPSVDL